MTDHVEEMRARRGIDKWTVAIVAAWLREQDGHGEWREAADAIDAEFLHDASLDQHTLREGFFDD